MLTSKEHLEIDMRHVSSSPELGAVFSGRDKRHQPFLKAQGSPLQMTNSLPLMAIALSPWWLLGERVGASAVPV